MIIPNLPYDFDEELSHRNFMNVDFTEAKDIFSGKNIYAASFYNERPDSVIFPPTMKGAVFVNCNMDNVILPPNNQYIWTNGLEPKRFQVQNDGNDWLIDAQNNPVKPVDFKIYGKLGLDVPKPEDIPPTRPKDEFGKDTVVDLKDEARKKKEQPKDPVPVKPEIP